MKRICIFTGDGDGKTTAAIGHAVRAAGRGKKVVFVQFMKGRKSGEHKVKIPKLEFHQFGTKNFVEFGNPNEKDKKLAKDGLDFAKKFLKDGVFMLVLDEVITAVNYDLLKKSQVADFLKLIPIGMIVILTGDDVPNEIASMADLITDMKKVRHPFDKGEDAIEGFEY